MSVAKNTLLRLQAHSTVVPGDIESDKELFARIISHSKSFDNLNEFVCSLPRISVVDQAIPSQDTLVQDGTKTYLEYVANKTGDIFTYAHSSFPFLHAFCLHFIRELEQAFSGKEYTYYPQDIEVDKYNHEQEVDKYMAYVVHSGKIPRVLYECKTNLGQNPLQLNSKDIIDLLLQGYYCLQNYNVTKMLICLTDLCEWHYMLIESSPENEKMVVTGYRHMEGLQLQQGINTSYSMPLSLLRKHTNFLIEMERSLHINN